MAYKAKVLETKIDISKSNRFVAKLLLVNSVHIKLGDSIAFTH